jgi:hypothetical protein
VIGHLLNTYYTLSAVLGLSGAILLWLSAGRAAQALRPWCAAAVPAAFGISAVNTARLFTDNDANLTAIAQGLSLYGLLVLYNALPYAALRHAHLTPVQLDEFVAEVGRQLNDTGEIPITLKDDDPGGDGVVT